MIWDRGNEGKQNREIEDALLSIKDSYKWTAPQVSKVSGASKD
jgi:hypothetical protein